MYNRAIEYLAQAAPKVACANKQREWTRRQQGRLLSLAEVLRRYCPQYERQFGSAILASQRRAVQAILSCRTPGLGGQLYRCADCRRDHFVYHSCNHLACPQCGQADMAQWVAQQEHKLLPVPYYLITFTVPERPRS